LGSGEETTPKKGRINRLKKIEENKMATDFFAQEDGQLTLGDTISCEVNTAVTVTIGAVVSAAVSVTAGLPKIALATATTVPLGVVIALGEGNLGTAGKIVTVLLCGTGRLAKVVASGAITVGELCKTTSNGKVQAMAGTATAEENRYVVGVALHTTTTDGDELAVLLR